MSDNVKPVWGPDEEPDLESELSALETTLAEVIKERETLRTRLAIAEADNAKLRAQLKQSANDAYCWHGCTTCAYAERMAHFWDVIGWVGRAYQEDRVQDAQCIAFSRLAHRSDAALAQAEHYRAKLEKATRVVEAAREALWLEGNPLTMPKTSYAVYAALKEYDALATKEDGDGR